MSRDPDPFDSQGLIAARDLAREPREAREHARRSRGSCLGSAVLLSLAAVAGFVLLRLAVQWQAESDAPVPLWPCLLPAGLALWAMLALPRGWKAVGVEIAKGYARGTLILLGILLGVVLLLLLCEVLSDAWA